MNTLLNFEKDYVLENERVKLTPLRNTDFDHLLPFAINEPELWKYSLTSGQGSANLKNYINSAIQKRREGTSYPFLIFDKLTQEYAGSTRFYDYQKTHSTVQLGFTWYGKMFQGTGLNKHCKYLMLDWAFDQLGVCRVEFRADNNNARSIAAMKSLGCTVEGVLRSNCKSLDGRRDSIILSILQEEWISKLKENLFARIKT